jgi:CelD/BcsL family acetyltransferase involved in cellulose biosynthesis
MVTCDVLTTRADLQRLEADWNRLADKAGDPLLRHDWFTAAAAVFARDGDLRVVTAHDESGLRAAVPLVRDRTGPVARLRLLGFQVMEPQDLLSDDRAALEAACRRALGLGLTISLPRLAAESEALDVLTSVARGRTVLVLRPSTTRTHANLIQSDWAAFEKAMPPRQASEIRRRRKRLAEAHGELMFEALSPEESQVEAALADLLRVEAASWKAREGTALLHDRTMGRFIADYARLAARAGILRLFNLRVAGEVVASQMMVEHGGRLWGIKLGADERFHKFGPGVMVTHDIMRWASERGLESFEHLGVAEDFQKRWPLLVREQSTVHVYPRNPGGAAALTADVLDFARRRLKSRLEAARARPADRTAPAAGA